MDQDPPTTTTDPVQQLDVRTDAPMVRYNKKDECHVMRTYFYGASN